MCISKAKNYFRNFFRRCEMKNNKTNTANPDKIGIGKFWAWQSRGASAAINFIVVSFVAIYCTDALGIPRNALHTYIMQ